MDVAKANKEHRWIMEGTAGELYSQHNFCHDNGVNIGSQPFEIFRAVERKDIMFLMEVRDHAFHVREFVSFSSSLCYAHLDVSYYFENPGTPHPLYMQCE